MRIILSESELIVAMDLYVRDMLGLPGADKVQLCWDDHSSSYTGEVEITISEPSSKDGDKKP